MSLEGGNPACDPTFLWSPDSRYLAITYKDRGSYGWSSIDDLKNNCGMSMPDRSEIENNLANYTDKDSGNIFLTQWLDNTHALVTFSWQSKNGKTVSGWFTCVFPNRSIQDLHFSNQ